MRIGVFGGSFDPIHNAHLIVAHTAREALLLDQVRLVVAAGQPLKSSGHGAGPRQRLEMVRRAVDGIAGFVVDDREVQRPGPSWTVDTLRALRAEFPADDLILLLGSDAAREFDRWREPAAIRALVSVAVCARAGEAAPEGFDCYWTVPALELSSRAIRARAAAGLSLAGWVPESVADYISGLPLYRSNSG